MLRRVASRCMAELGAATPWRDPMAWETVASSWTSTQVRHMAKAAKKKQPVKKKAQGAPKAEVNPRMKAAVDQYKDILFGAVPRLTKEQMAENISEEELKEFQLRAAEYSRKKMAQHRAFQKDINDKIRHKRAAIAALPPGYLRDHAETPDNALFPLKRRLPGWDTPAIEGYYEEKQRAMEEAVMGGKDGVIGSAGPSR